MFAPGGRWRVDRSSSLELQAEARIDLGAVVIHRAHLGGVERIVFQQAVGQVSGVQGEGDVRGERVVQRRVQHAVVVLVFRRAAVQADEEVRPVGGYCYT